jgi:NAD(P)-dependent dehydrogenase (short-subunit alcohol dehydrogenase family)
VDLGLKDRVVLITGIIGLTASLAKELGPQGILVNAVAPTQVLTMKDGTPSIPEERGADMAESIPVRRLATPDDLASVVLWLASAGQHLRQRPDHHPQRWRPELRAPSEG